MTQEVKAEVMASPAAEQPQQLEVNRMPFALQQKPELSVDSVVEQIEALQSLMSRVMKPGIHYGVIPGTDKPTLLKPGAELLCVLFRLAPKLTVERRDLEKGHREYEVLCELRNINTDRWWGQGVGVCTTLESRYRYRTAKRKCPACDQEAIIKGKEQYGGGWVCWKQKGGCGAKYVDNDEAITAQSAGKKENPDIADVYNTVKKISKKRALVDAVLTCTAASFLFGQDLDDFPPDANDKDTSARSLDGLADEMEGKKSRAKTAKPSQEDNKCRHGLDMSEFCKKCSAESDAAMTAKDEPSRSRRRA